MVFGDNWKDIPIHQQLQECLFPISCSAQGTGTALVMNDIVTTMIFTDDSTQSSSLGEM